MKEKLSSSSRPSLARPVHLWGPGKGVIAVLLALITVVAALARIHAINAKGFWGDEANSVAIARLPWADFARLLWHHEANMALYYLLLRFWLHLGTTEGMIRGLSALLSVATVPLVYALGRRLLDPITGLLAAWLLAINAYHVRYAQETRSYALVVFLCALATWILVRNLQEPSSAHWGVYAAACVLVAYSHFFGALVILAHCISLPFLRRGEVPWRQILRSLLWFIYLMIPIVWFVASAGSGSLTWVSRMDASALLGFFSSLSGNYGIPLLVLVAVAAGLATLGGWTLWREDGPTLKTWAYALVFVWLFVPVLVVAAVSVVRPMFVARYLNPCLPALTLIVAAGITQLRPAVLAGVFCAAISVCSMLGTASYYRQDFDLGLERRDWRAATSLILDHAQPGDGVFFYGGSGHMLFEFFRHARRPSPAWPQVLESENGLDVSYGDFF